MLQILNAVAKKFNLDLFYCITLRDTHTVALQGRVTSASLKHMAEQHIGLETTSNGWLEGADEVTFKAEGITVTITLIVRDSIDEERIEE